MGQREKVGRDIDFKWVQIISERDAHRLTLAIELNSDDYTLLHDPSFWSAGLRFRKFIGWRWWHGEKKARVKPQGRQNTVRGSWATT